MNETERRRRFEAISLEHLDAAYSFACSLTRDAAEAEDLVQDSYLAAFRKFDRCPGDMNFKAWLFTILRNRFLDVRRRTTRYRSVLRRVERSAHANAASATTGRRPERDEITATLDALPEIYRTVLVLAYRDEMKTDDIARVVGRPRGTVLSRLARGRALMRRVWEARTAEGRRRPAPESVPSRGCAAGRPAFPVVQTGS